MTLFFCELTETEKMFAYFTQDIVTTHTDNFSITAQKKYSSNMIPHRL